MYFYHSGVLSKLRLPWKTELPWNFHCIEYVFFIIQDFWATCACPEKQSLPWKFSLYWIYFLHSGVLRNLRLLWKAEGALSSMCSIFIFYFQDFWATSTWPEKHSLPWNFPQYGTYFYSQNFEQVALALKSRGCPKLTVLNLYFLFSGVLSKLRLPSKTELLWTFHYIEYVFFMMQDFWATCACLEKQSLPWKFPLYETYILHSEFWASCAYPEKQSCPGIFTVLNI